MNRNFEADLVSPIPTKNGLRMSTLSPNFNKVIASNVKLTLDGKHEASELPRPTVSSSSKRRSVHGDGREVMMMRGKRTSLSTLSPAFSKGKLVVLPGKAALAKARSSSALLVDNESYDNVRPSLSTFQQLPIDTDKEQQIRIVHSSPTRSQILKVDDDDDDDATQVVVAFLEYFEDSLAEDSFRNQQNEDNDDNQSDSSTGSPTQSSHRDVELVTRYLVRDNEGTTIARIVERVKNGNRTIPAHLMKKDRMFRLYTSRPVFAGQIRARKPRGSHNSSRKSGEQLYHAADVKSQPSGILGNSIKQTMKVHLSNGKRTKYTMVVDKSDNNNKSRNKDKMMDQKRLLFVNDKHEQCASISRTLIEKQPTASTTTSNSKNTNMAAPDADVTIQPGTDPLLASLFFTIIQNL